MNEIDGAKAPVRHFSDPHERRKAAVAATYTLAAMKNTGRAAGAPRVRGYKPLCDKRNG